MHVVWFKRDLRIRDHAPLVQAARNGPCVCLYVYEPEIYESEEFDASHLEFINQSLGELDDALKLVGGHLTYRVGRMPDVLAALHRESPIEVLWSHQETGNGVTYDRDRRVKRWARDHEIPWHESRQNGVIRCLDSRDGWSAQWNAWMSRPTAADLRSVDMATGIDPEQPATAEDLNLPAHGKSDLQRGGSQAGDQLLRSFLKQRGRDYPTEMSSPLTAHQSCSRLSPYLAWGCLSVKQVVRQLQVRDENLRFAARRDATAVQWRKSLAAYRSRLSWHCHFMQKLEDEPAIEFQNMHRGYDGLREDEFRQSYFDAWSEGQTGFPMVDACMRALRQHSWINFRMRALLVSFASYHLWLHWRPTALFLARHFLDFEPGIHYSQVQMQSGTTGINSIRIYSPVKQALDQDPDGEFIRQYVPELSAVPTEFIAEPHKMPLSVQDRCGCRIGINYPRPMVDHLEAYRAARRRFSEVRVASETRQESQRVFQRHGSRRRARARGSF